MNDVLNIFLILRILVGGGMWVVQAVACGPPYIRIATPFIQEHSSFI